MANNLGFAAAVAQATPRQAHHSVNRRCHRLLALADRRGADARRRQLRYALPVPTDKPANNSFEGHRRSKLLSHEYIKVQMPGEVVCDDTFDLLLRRIELARSVGTARMPLTTANLWAAQRRF